MAERPDVERKNSNPNKRIVAQRSMADVIAEGRSFAGGGASATSFAAGDLFKKEALAAMGQTPTASSTPTNEFRTPQHALEAFERKEVAIAEMPGIIAKLGIATDEEVSDMTPKQAFAALKDEIDEDNAEVDKAIAKKEGKSVAATKKVVEPVVKASKKEKVLKTVDSGRVAAIKLELRAKKAKVAKKTVKKAKKKIVRKKAQYKNPLIQAPTPVQAPQSPTNPTSTETIDIPDPVTGELKKYNKLADGTLVPMTAVAKVKKENPPKSVRGSRLPMDGRQDSAVVGKAKSTASSSENKYVAKFSGTKWVVSNGRKAVFSVTANDAFPGKEKENGAIWLSAEYGEELGAACRLRGAAAVISDVYKGHVKLEAQKTVCDYEADIVEALEESNPVADELVKEFSVQYPEKSREVVALYNDSSITVDQLGGRIRATASKRLTAQFDDGVLNVENDISQEPAAVMTPEAAAESVDEEDAEKNVVDLLAEVLAPIIAATGVWEVDDVIVQLKETFSNDEAIASFKGKLEEKIKQDEKQEKVVIEEKSEEEQAANQVDEQKQLDSYKKAMKITLRNVKASLSKLGGAIHKDSKTDKRIASIIAKGEHKTKTLDTRIAALTNDLESARGDVENLLKERSARLRYPRAKKLAEKMEKIGIKTPVKDIMLYTDTQFEEKSKEVEGIFETVGHRESSYSGEKLISGGMPSTSEATVNTVANPFRSSNPEYSG